MISLGIIPRLDKSVTSSKSSSFICALVVEVETSTSESVFNMVDNLLLDIFFTCRQVGAHELPHLFLTFFLGMCFMEFRLNKCDKIINILLTL